MTLAGVYKMQIFTLICFFVFSLFSLIAFIKVIRNQGIPALNNIFWALSATGLFYVFYYN